MLGGPCSIRGRSRQIRSGAKILLSPGAARTGRGPRKERINDGHQGGDRPDADPLRDSSESSKVIGLVAAVGGAVAAIVGVVIAYLAWIQPHSPDSGSGPGAGNPAASTSASGIGPSPATVPAGQPGRYLPDLPPPAGAGSAAIPPRTRGGRQF